ncbi:MAG: ISNCY family transposase [Methylobacter sp.]
MAKKRELFRMTDREIRKYHIVKKVIEEGLKQKDAARLLGISVRQVRRIEKRIREEGTQGIIHRNRGQESPFLIKRKVRDQILELCRSKYEGFNPTLASEKLFEINKIEISRETVRQLFLKEGIHYSRRKVRKHRHWRERKHQVGEMVQMDGSLHDWFEGRGPKCVLMGYIDDANNCVFARFYEYEGTLPAMGSFKEYVQRNGFPLNVYLDRHSTYKSTCKATIEDELNNREPMSQFGRALKELGVGLIYAQSPQAKGRVERLFRTVQDRLVKEMRLKGISNIKDANAFLENYLPIYNKRFSIEPAESGNMHQPNDPVALEKALRIKTPRTLRNDFTIVHESQWYQIEDQLKAKEVVVEQRLNGTVEISHAGRPVKYHKILVRVPQKQVKPAIVIGWRRKCMPVQDHPWKRMRTLSRTKTEAEECSLAGVF